MSLLGGGKERKLNKSWEMMATGFAINYWGDRTQGRFSVSQ